MTNLLDTRLHSILSAGDLVTLNQRLTDFMKLQQLQPLLKNENLGKVVEAVLKLTSNFPNTNELYAAATLGRLAAVARGRELEVYSRVNQIFSNEPPSIETLAAGDEKEYAAKALAHVNARWLLTYCARESLALETANNARKELFRILLGKDGDISSCLLQLVEASSIIQSIEQPESRIKRVRRIFECLSDVIKEYEGSIGQAPGRALATLVETFLQSSVNSDDEASEGSLDAAMAILDRIIELRFSYALHGETYELIQCAKRLFTPVPWERFLKGSKAIRRVRMNLLETALVLARQNRTDKLLVKVMEAIWPSTFDATNAVKQHFVAATDIAPDVANYWLKLGRVSQTDRRDEQRLGNTEDEQIGELLIQLDINRENMNKLNRAVVPVLKTFDAFQAATVERAAIGYEGIAQIAERLARMRRLSKTDLLGSILEYNPIEHDMEGGHRSGVRRVKVVRDGILKEFGGKIKTLVKPRVEAED